MPGVLASFFTIAGDAELVYMGGNEISPHSLRERIEVAGQAGFRGIGLLDNDLTYWSELYSPSTIRSLLSDNGIDYVELEMLSLWYVDGSVRRVSDGVRTRLLRWAEYLEAHHIKVGTDPIGRPADHGQLVEEFGRLCDDAAEVGTRIALEPMPTASIKTPAAAMEIITQSGRHNGGVLLDVWHVARTETPYDEIAKLPSEFIVGVELCDAARKPNASLILDGSEGRTLPGEGGLEVPAFVSAVLSTGYDGMFGVEIFSRENRERDLQTAARGTHDAAQRVFAAAEAQ